MVLGTDYSNIRF